VDIHNEYWKLRENAITVKVKRLFEISAKTKSVMLLQRGNNHKGIF